jgi:hypothetical protein
LRQLEKWRNLDKRESEESETLRKRKIELEIELKELKSELEQLTTVTEQRENKYQTRIQKYKDSLKEHAVYSQVLLPHNRSLSLDRMQSRKETRNWNRKTMRLSNLSKDFLTPLTR